MTEKNYPIFELIIRIIGAVVTVAGVLIGIYQYSDQKAHNDELEFRRKMWEKRADAYSDIGNIVASIVTNNVDTSLQRLNTEFLKRYWGTLVLVEDSLVEQSMIKFKNEVNDKLKGYIDINDTNRLRLAGYDLMKTCQKSLNTSWKSLEK